MARARNIKPDFFKNEILATCSPMARLLFIGLWLLADREGRLEDRPRRIKGELFPYEEADVDALLSELERHGFVKRYKVDTTAVVLVVNFVKHQRPHPNEAASQLPACSGNVTSDSDKGVSLTPDAITNCAPSPFLNPSSLNPSSSNGDYPPLSRREVEDALHRRGVAAAGDACEEAIRNGVSPSEVAAIIAVYDTSPGAWGPGALYKRVSIARPGDDPMQGWSPVSEEYAKRRRESEAAAKRAEQDRRRADDADRLERERQEREALERRHGPKLDAMSPAEREALLLEAFDGDEKRAAIYRNHEWDSPMLRVYLYPVMARREANRNGA